MTDPLTPPPPVRWGRLLAILAIVVAVPTVTIEVGKHRRFVAFAAQRDAWHAACDRYRDTPLTNPSARACNEELVRLTALATREGWN